MNDLMVAAVFFVGTHLGIAGTQVRGQLIDRIGVRMYRLLYSLLGIIALIWLVAAFRDAPYRPFWHGGEAARHLPLLIMPIALLLLVSGVTAPNPTSVGQAPDPDAAEPARGILRVTRHPVMWGVGLWAIAHVLANPDLASLIFFGSLGLLAFAGCHSLDSRLGRNPPPGWGVFVQRTSFVPFAAIVDGRQKFVGSEIGWWRVALALALYVLLLVLHPYLFGVPVIPGT
ncbi:MAG: NnrU family protein [Geminicoccaceae bacterium]|nr:NnrU family protein [Geminicoccaceae bacterium]